VATELEDALKARKPFDVAVKELLTKLVKENKRIIFNGNNYTEEWRKEAARRGLLNHANTVDALPELMKPDVVKIFEKYKVLNSREIHARHEVAVETYVKTVNVEQLMVLMANRYILPAALKPEGRRRLSDVRRAASCSTREAKRLLGRISDWWTSYAATDKLAKALEHHAPNVEKHASSWTAWCAMVDSTRAGQSSPPPHAVWPPDLPGDAVYQVAPTPR
jgi:glutamine synthetase type III